jgi:peptidyl-prolyl cis-trans isomerase B (cyclophilin B)
VLASVLGVLVLLVVAVLLDEGPRSGVLGVSAPPTDRPSPPPRATAATPTPSTSPRPVGCRYVIDGEPARPVLPPGPPLEDDPALSLLLRTTAGDVDVVLDQQAAPCAVNSLRHLARVGFYDATPCHRLVDRGIFVLQCGDPTGTGLGGPGYRFAEEALEEARYPRGTVAMVNSGPSSTGSQFFLVYQDSPLPAQYTPVGTIGEAGLAVLDAVAAAGAGPVDANGVTPPAVPVQVLQVAVEALPE